MKVHLRKILDVTGFLVGIGLVVGMSTDLANRLKEAEGYQEIAAPIINQYIASMSGAEDAPRPPQISLEDRAQLIFLEMGDRRISPEAARLALIGGIFVLIIFGVRLFAEKPTGAEQVDEKADSGAIAHRGKLPLP